MMRDQLVHIPSSNGTPSSGESSVSDHTALTHSTHAQDGNLLHGRDDTTTMHSVGVDAEPGVVDISDAHMRSFSSQSSNAPTARTAEVERDAAPLLEPPSAGPDAVTTRPRRRPPGSGIEVRSFGTARTCEAPQCSTRLSRYNPDHFCSVHRGWDGHSSTRRAASEE